MRGFLGPREFVFRGQIGILAIGAIYKYTGGKSDQRVGSLIDHTAPAVQETGMEHIDPHRTTQVNIAISLIVRNAGYGSLLRLRYNTTCKRASSMASWIPWLSEEGASMALTLGISERCDTTSSFSYLWK